MNWKEAPADEMVCYCMNVTKQNIIDAIKDGATSVSAVIRKTGATGGCGSCASSVEEVFNLNKM